MVRGHPQPECHSNDSVGKGETAMNCKILLPKFNTWKQVLLERKNGSEAPLGNAFGAFSANFCCHSSQMASPLHRNGNAIAP